MTRIACFAKLKQRFVAGDSLFLSSGEDVAARKWLLAAALVSGKGCGEDAAT